MKVVGYCWGGAGRVARSVLDDFLVGVGRFGHKTETRIADDFGGAGCGRCGCIVTIGWRGGICDLHTDARDRGVMSIAIGDGYVRRGRHEEGGKWGRYFGVSRGGLQAYGEHYWERDLSGERWRDLGVEVRPWSSGGEKIIVAHQYGDEWRYSREDRGRGKQDWFRLAVKEAVKTGREVVLCLHPGWEYSKRELKGWAKLRCRIGGRVSTEFEGAGNLVTWDSASTVEGVIAGVPSYALRRTMALPMCGGGMFEVRKPDRDWWVRWLAWQQWRPGEMREGLAWKYLTGR